MFFLNRFCQLHVMDIFNMCNIKINPNFAPFGSFVCICISFTDNLQHIPYVYLNSHHIFYSATTNDI